jgi:hypothetical protein
LVLKDHSEKLDLIVLVDHGNKGIQRLSLHRARNGPLAKHIMLVDPPNFPPHGVHFNAEFLTEMNLLDGGVRTNAVFVELLAAFEFVADGVGFPLGGKLTNAVGEDEPEPDVVTGCLDEPDGRLSVRDGQGSHGAELAGFLPRHPEFEALADTVEGVRFAFVKTIFLHAEYLVHLGVRTAGTLDVLLAGGGGRRADLDRRLPDPDRTQEIAGIFLRFCLPHL